VYIFSFCTNITVSKLSCMRYMRNYRGSLRRVKAFTVVTWCFNSMYSAKLYLPILSKIRYNTNRAITKVFRARVGYYAHSARSGTNFSVPSFLLLNRSTSTITIFDPTSQAEWLALDHYGKRGDRTIQRIWECNGHDVNAGYQEQQPYAGGASHWVR